MKRMLGQHGKLNEEGDMNVCERCGKHTRVLVAVFVGMGSWLHVCHECWCVLCKPMTSSNARPTEFTRGSLEKGY